MEAPKKRNVWDAHKFELCYCIGNLVYFKYIPPPQSPEDMRYWVHALRYIKAYWAKMEVRETVLSDEQERKLLERILSEEELDEDVSHVICVLYNILACDLCMLVM